MRKIYQFIILSFLIVSGIKAQIVFSENFNSTVPTGLPTGWGQLNSEWLTDASDCCSGTIPVCTIFGTSGGNVLAFGDGSSNPEERVTTSAFSTTGVSSMTLTWNGIRFDGTSPAVTLSISDDNFATSSTIPYTNVGGTNTWGTISIAIPVTFENKASVKLRWTYVGGSTFSYAGYDDIVVTGVFSPVFFYNGTGPVDALSSWGTNTNGSGSNPANFTSNGQTFNLINATSVNFNNMVGSSWTLGGTGSKLTIGTGTSAINVTIPTTNTFITTGSASLALSNQATLTLQNTNFPTSRLQYSTGSTVVYAQSGGTVTIPGTPHHNIVLNGGGVRQTSGVLTINGNLAINSSNLQLSGSPLGNLILNGNLTGSGLILTGNSRISINGTGALGTLNFGTGTSTLSINRLDLNRTSSGNITLGTNLTITGVSSLTNGDINLNGNKLSMNGAITFPASAANGVFVGSTTSSLEIGGSGTITNNLLLSQSSSSTKAIKEIILNRSGANLTLGNAVEAWGSITPTVGTIITGGNLTLKADGSNKGRIGQIGSSGALSGNVTVEVFKPAGVTGWVNLCSGGVVGNNMGSWNSSFAITCSVCPDGWSVGSNTFTSLYEYDETAATGNAADPLHYIELGVTPTSKPLDSKTGYWVYLGNGFPNTSAITIPLTGNVNTGALTSIPLSLTGGASSENGWNLIANPYPSPIVANQITGTNFNSATMIGYDPDTDSNVPFTGSAIIPMGQAFMVQGISGGANLTPQESWKAATADNSSILKLASTSSNYYYDDFLIDVTSNIVPRNFFTQAYFAFGNSYTNGYDIGECPSFPGQETTTPRFYAKTSGMNLLRTTLPNLNGSVTIPLILETGFAGLYTFNPVNLNHLPAGACVTLHDIVNNVNHNLKTGSYIANIAANATTPQFELIITVNQTNLTSSYVDPTCTKLANGNITANAQGTGPWNYTWKDENFNIIKTTSNSTNSTDVLTNVAVGKYLVDISKTGTCDNAQKSFVLNSITPLPVAMMTANTTTAIAGNNVPVTFYNQSTNAIGYEWSVNDGSNPVNSYNTTHLFNDEGFYTVTLKAYNGACLDTAFATQNIIVYEQTSSPVGIANVEKAENNYFFSKDEKGLFVMFKYDEFKDVEFQVSNILGQVLIPNQILSVSTSKHYYKVPDGEQIILVTIKENGIPKTNKVLNK